MHTFDLVSMKLRELKIKSTVLMAYDYYVEGMIIEIDVRLTNIFNLFLLVFELSINHNIPSNNQAHRR